MSEHHHAAHGQHAHADSNHLPDDAPARMLDLDAEILEGPLRAVRADIADLVDRPVRRILDLGAGTGTGTFGLLQHFAGAHAVAIDGSSDLLERLRRRAGHLGLANRVTTLHADLDRGVPALDLVDLAWASGSLHHLADPDHTLAQVAAAIRPGGLLAVVELTGHPRFLTDGAPGATAEAAAHALLARDRTVDMPAMGSDWAGRLADAGLVIELDRPIVVDLAPPLPDVAGSYAFAILTRIRGAVVERLGAAELADLDRLLDGGASDVRHRSDLHVRTERQLTIARARYPTRALHEAGTASDTAVWMLRAAAARDAPNRRWTSTPGTAGPGHRRRLEDHTGGARFDQSRGQLEPDHRAQGAAGRREPSDAHDVRLVRTLSRSIPVGRHRTRSPPQRTPAAQLAGS